MIKKIVVLNILIGAVFLLSMTGTKAGPLTISYDAEGRWVYDNRFETQLPGGKVTGISGVISADGIIWSSDGDGGYCLKSARGDIPCSLWFQIDSALPMESIRILADNTKIPGATGYRDYAVFKPDDSTTVKVLIKKGFEKVAPEEIYAFTGGISWIRGIDKTVPLDGVKSVLVGYETDRYIELRGVWFEVRAVKKISEKAKVIAPARTEVTQQIPKHDIEKGWSDTPHPWSSLPVEVQEELQQGCLRFSHQIPESPFGAQLPTMDDGIDMDNIVFLLDQFSATGMKWLRDGVVAGVSQEGKVNASRGPVAESWKELKIPEYYFTFCKEARARGINILATIRVVGLGGKVTGSGERGRNALAEWCKVVIPALKPWIKDWEIDNEPNPEIPPEEYVSAVRTAYKVIKGIDLEAKVYAGVVAGLECLAPASRGGREPYSDPESCYIDGLLSAGLLDVCDVFSFHSYRQPYVVTNIPEHASEYEPWNKWSDYISQINELKTRLRKASKRDFPIAITEFAYTSPYDAKTGKRVIPQETGVKYELRAGIMDHYLGISPIINFAFKRQIRGPYEPEAHFIMVTPDGIRQPKYYAYSGLCALLDGRDKPLEISVQPLSVPKNVADSLRFYTFHRQEKISNNVESIDIITIAFWQAVVARDDGTVVPIDIEITLPNEKYGYPILLDPRNIFTTPYKPLAYRQKGNIYILTSLPSGDSPLMVRFLCYEK